MRIHHLLIAGILLCSSVYAVDQRITASDPKEEEDMQLLAERISARLANLRKSRAERPAAAVARKSSPNKSKLTSTDATTTQARTYARDWQYEGENGAAHWGSMNPAWAKCASGTRQSPIDIRDGIRVDLEPVKFNYLTSNFNVLDNGHTVQVGLGMGNTISLTGRTYALQQFHFHLPSEERINGKSFPMVLHLVHKDEAGRYAVVALLVEEGEPHEVVQQVWNNLPLEKQDPVMATGQLELEKLLPMRREYYTYMGSFTTPPCSEGVLWIVMKEPIHLSSQQIAIFARLYAMNARPIQPSTGRIIKESH